MRVITRSIVLLAATWIINSAAVVFLLPEDVLLPAWPFYVAYLLFPSLSGYWAVVTLA